MDGARSGTGGWLDADHTDLGSVLTGGSATRVGCGAVIPADQEERRVGDCLLRGVMIEFEQILAEMILLKKDLSSTSSGKTHSSNKWIRRFTPSDWKSVHLLRGKTGNKGTNGSSGRSPERRLASLVADVHTCAAAATLLASPTYRSPLGDLVYPIH